MVNEHQAKCSGRDIPVSTKHSIEICNMIRGKSLQQSKEMLQKVISQEKAVPFKRFNKDVGHRKGSIGPGRYPEKACTHIYKLLESVEINAQNKGLDTGLLMITKLVPNEASRPMHFGRMRRRRMKRTHIEIIVEEKAEKSKREADKK